MGFGKIFKKVAKFALPIVGSAVGGPVGASLGSAAGALVSGGNLKQALLSGAGTYLGSSIGGSLGSSLGTVGSATGLTAAGTLPWQAAANTGLGSSLANIIGSSAANSIASTRLGSALGGFYGSSIGESLGAKNSGTPQPVAAQAASPAPFKPTREAEEELPSSLSAFSSLSPMQRTSNLATKGVYGNGLGQQESNYYLNQINREMIDDAGNVDSNLSDLTDIDKSFLQKLGISGYSNSNDLLEAISKWKQAA